MLSRIERAKQFLPFDALNGLQEALRKQEKDIEYEEKIDLTDESLEELERQFNKIRKGDNVTIKYYRINRYIEFTGIITKIDYNKKRIQLNNLEEINICDILDIKI